jgi:hypothetical protein
MSKSLIALIILVGSLHSTIGDSILKCITRIIDSTLSIDLSYFKSIPLVANAGVINDIAVGRMQIIISPLILLYIISNTVSIQRRHGIFERRDGSKNAKICKRDGILKG